MLLHDVEELDDDFGAWSDEDLPLAGLFGVVDRFEGIVEDTGSNHYAGTGLRFSSGRSGLRYLRLGAHG